MPVCAIRDIVCGSIRASTRHYRFRCHSMRQFATRGITPSAGSTEAFCRPSRDVSPPSGDVIKGWLRPSTIDLIQYSLFSRSGLFFWWRLVDHPGTVRLLDRSSSNHLAKQSCKKDLLATSSHGCRWDHLIEKANGRSHTPMLVYPTSRNVGFVSSRWAEVMPGHPPDKLRFDAPVGISVSSQRSYGRLCANR